MLMGWLQKRGFKRLAQAAEAQFSPKQCAQAENVFALFVDFIGFGEMKALFGSLPDNGAK